MYRMKKLIIGDIKNITRDSLLIITILAPILLALFIKFFIPLVNSMLYERMGFKLSPYYNIIMGTAFMLIPMIIGCMAGFILLEDKDENVLSYFEITPLRKKGYLIYRLTSPIILSVFLSVFLFYFSNLIKISFIKVILIIVIASMEAPIITLILGSIAENRVEGLALSKLIGIFFALPIILSLVDIKYKWLLGFFPTYWIPKMLNGNLYSSLDFILYMMAAFSIHVIYIFVFGNKFIR